jgi:hypothetical protein
MLCCINGVVVLQSSLAPAMQHKKEVGCCVVQSCAPLPQSTIIVVALCKTMFVCFLQYNIKHTLASHGVKAQLLHECEATSQQLCVWRAFLTSFF